VPLAPPSAAAAAATPGRARDPRVASPLSRAQQELEAEPILHTGFSMRLGASLGVANIHRKLAKGRTKVGGIDGGLSLDFGGTPIENLIVYGRMSGYAWNHASTSDSPNVGTAYVGTIGAGARYHFMPFDWYASGTLSLAAVKVTSDLGEAQNAHPGFGLELDTGKNWWIGTNHDKRAMALGLRFAYVNCSPSRASKRDDHPWVGTAISLVFSTAYN
jgi:hypothetical protein